MENSIQQQLDALEAEFAKKKQDLISSQYVGKCWDSTCNGKKFKCTFVNSMCDIFGYGFDSSGFFNTQNKDSSYCVVNGLNLESLEPLPESEFTKLMEAEAIKRGLVAGATIDRSDIEKGILFYGAKIELGCKNYIFNIKNNIFKCDDKIIFHNGIWAKVVEKPKPKKLDEWADEFEKYANTSLLNYHNLFKNFIIKNNLKLVQYEQPNT
jgi:hypothetical protein